MSVSPFTMDGGSVDNGGETSTFITSPSPPTPAQSAPVTAPDTAPSTSASHAAIGPAPGSVSSSESASSDSIPEFRWGTPRPPASAPPTVPGGQPGGQSKKNGKKPRGHAVSTSQAEEETATQAMAASVTAMVGLIAGQGERAEKIHADQMQMMMALIASLKDK